MRGGREGPHATGAAGLLAGVGLLAELDADALARVAHDLEPVALRAGEWLFRQGDDAQEAYVIASGRMEVVREDDPPTVIRVLRRGGVIGELALLHGGVRSAGVRASRDAALLRLGRERFEALLRDVPGFALALTRTLGAQLAVSAALPAQVEAPRVVAVVALDDGAPVGRAAEAIAGELAAAGTLARAQDTELGPAEVWGERFGALERDHDRVLLTAAAADPAAPWTAFCVREADLVVAVGAGPPHPGWAGAAAGLEGCELLACGPGAAVPGARPRLVRAATGDAGLEAAARNAGRRLAGRAVGVVFSGGGARAFAHIGVVAALREAGVGVDRVAGVSLGSIVAGLVAMGRTDDEMLEVFEANFVAQNPTSDYTLPVVSLIRGRRTARLLRGVFGDTRIEELPIPFFCASVDIVRRELVVHRSGSLADAILASLSIPGIFPPLVDGEGRVLVDGGVIDNLPVGEMAARAEGPVVAVDVTGVADSGRTVRRGGPLSGALEGVRGRVTGSRAPLPRLPETIVRCMTLASSDTVAAGRRHADLVISPRVAGVGMLQWDRLAVMRQAGVDATRAALRDAPRSIVPGGGPAAPRVTEGVVA